MGVQLDWQIESDRSQQRATEDPDAKFRRKRVRRNLFIVMMVIVVLVGIVVGAILWRLNAVDNQIRQNLLDTVDVEIAAIRVGNEANYMQVKRSANEAWLQQERQAFDDYQQLKQTGQLNLTGHVSDVTIDEPRARVVLEEIIADVPYRIVWFYWLYGDDESGQGGWRRVPPDTEFWGDEQRSREDGVTVDYHDLDKPLAEAMGVAVRRWWTDGCVLLQCETPLNDLTIVIEPESQSTPQWDLYDEWRLNVSSPLYQGRARNDVPFTPELQIAVAQLLAERMVTHRLNGPFQPEPYTDADWLYGQYIGWLVGHFTQDANYGSPFFDSLMTQFGEALPGTLIGALTPKSEIGILEFATSNVAIPDLGVERLDAMNWANFFQWRLDLEKRTLLDSTLAPTYTPYYDLYDMADPNAEAAAHIRRNEFNPTQDPPIVNNVEFGKEQDRLLAYVNVVLDVTDLNQRQTIIFRWVDMTWKRIS